MFKASFAALVAVLMVASAVTEVVAKPAGPPPPPCAMCGGDGGGDTGDTGDGDPSSGHPGGSGNPGTEVCNVGLKKLGQVTEAMIDSFIAGKVRIVPVCEGTTKVAGLDDSQVLGLRDDIAGNALLAQKLRARGYDADDVFALVFTADGARLFVHKV